MSFSRQSMQLIFAMILCLMTISTFDAEMQPPSFPVGFFSPTRSKLATIKDEKTLEITLSSNGSSLLSKNNFANLNGSVVWNPDDLGIAVTDAYDLLIWDDVTQSGNATPSRTLKYYDVLGITPRVSANDAAWSPNGQFVALSVGSSIFVWDGTTGQHIYTLSDSYVDHVTGEQEFWDFIRFLYWPENEHLVFADASGRLYVYSLTESKVTKIYLAPVVNQYSPIITAVAVSHSGEKLAIAEEYLQASFVWEFDKPSTFETIPNANFFFGHGESRVSAIAWRADDLVVASLGEDRLLRVWNPDTAQEYYAVMLPNDASINTISWSDDGSAVDYITLLGEIGTVEINGVPTMKLPPVADAGPAQNVTDSDNNAVELITLDGSASNDSDGNIIAYTWMESGIEIAVGSQPQITLGVGSHIITLTVTDNDGLTDTDEVVINIIEPTPTATNTLTVTPSYTPTVSPTFTPTLSLGCSTTVVANDAPGLISAISSANGNGSSVDTICLTANSTYTLTAVNNSTDGPNGLPSITTEIVIIGNGATISRDPAAPALRIFHVAAGGSLTLDG